MSGRQQTVAVEGRNSAQVLPTREPVAPGTGLAPSIRGMSTKRVLVVDDQTPVRELVAAVLTADGYAVETARDGADALRLLDAQSGYDLIVSDLKMPGLDGPSLYLELTRRWPDTRPHLLFISGFVESPEYAGFLQGTGVQVLLKPFAVDALSAAVLGILGRS
jgi:DNA-binding response OmpR family regulator